MKRIPLPGIILSIFLLSLLYWLYLAFYTSVAVVFDSLEYERLGRVLQHQGLMAYIKDGPQNEPIYPLFISLAMSIENFTGIGYAKIMAIFGVIILSVTQTLTYAVLRQLRIRVSICALVLIYLGLSPALLNSAFSLYSEIAAYPFILGIVLAAFACWRRIEQNNKKAVLFGGLLGICSAAATLVKAVFECVFPAYLIIFATTALLTHKKQISKKLTTMAILAAAVFYYIPITGYKWLNQNLNGNFVITNRAPWALYGNTARRVEPLTPKKFLAGLAYVPGEGVCNGIFGPKECNFWSYRVSDYFGLTKLHELTDRHLSSSAINDTLLHLSVQKAIQNPAQYIVLTITEGFKMFFWESTKIGYVNYPPWLTRIYNHTLFKNILRLMVSLTTILAFFYGWIYIFKCQQVLTGFILTLLTLTIAFYSPFFILTRYALPLAPLYLIISGYALERFFF